MDEICRLLVDSCMSLDNLPSMLGVVSDTLRILTLVNMILPVTGFSPHLYGRLIA
jgi:hypothetical protein